MMDCEAMGDLWRRDGGWRLSTILKLPDTTHHCTYCVVLCTVSILFILLIVCFVCAAWKRCVEVYNAKMGQNLCLFLFEKSHVTKSGKREKLKTLTAGSFKPPENLHNKSSMGTFQ